MSEGDKYIGKTIADLQAEHDLDQVRQLHRQMDEVEQRIKALNEKHGISPEMMPKTRLIDEPFRFDDLLLRHDELLPKLIFSRHEMCYNVS
jgi:hypothetical protein